MAFALAVFGRYLSPRGLTLGLFAGISVVAGYALATRLFPSHFAAPERIFSYQLAVPLGYWNALGLLAAMGMILAVGVVGSANARAWRMTAGAATCVIAPAMLFTFSRGAWVAAAIGFGVGAIAGAAIASSAYNGGYYGYDGHGYYDEPAYVYSPGYAYESYGYDGYAYARYLMEYLQDHDKLHAFYERFNGDKDTTGQVALAAVVGEDLATFEPKWRKWVLGLKGDNR